MNDINTSVLVIDDEELVRDNIEEILAPLKNTQHDDFMNEAASILFDAPRPLLAPRTSNIPVFTVDKAANGMEGLDKVKKALQNGTPYAVIFLDMRMPGWDGLETAIKIREHDSKAEIIFITAYSDRSIDEIVEKAGQNVGYHCKPYASEEIIQLATKAVTDYSRLRNLEKLIESISSIGLNKNQLNSLLKNILDQLANSVDTDMALLGKLHDDYAYEKVISIGAMEERVNLEELVNRVKDIKINEEEVLQIDELVLARMDDYSVFAVLKKQERLKTERMYLLKLFVQNAAQAIRNAELNEKLLQKEKLSAVGKAMGMVMHDLRSPVKNIKLIAQLMREENAHDEWIDMLEQSADQASEIFDDFLDFIRETSIKKQPVQIRQMIEAAIQQSAVHPYAAQVKLSQDLQESLAVLGDESKLKRSIGNLLNNAFEALKDHHVGNPAVHISAVKSQDMVVITIADNGVGIPDAISRTLFEPFVTRDKSNGTGLGLAIVKQFITAHNGNITVENNNGAQFIITIPLM
ncbi:hybrid sensor histidine kinase/response regulator [Mucilaginibacter sp. PAMB04168]|uniref:hybrid sensor histidine kinase/response regulator n=1 Tax=Mucilaginibacter sp. PAMB04168 TaxID=3138567 RepID=UPI0031F63CEE